MRYIILIAAITLVGCGKKNRPCTCYEGSTEIGIYPIADRSTNGKYSEKCIEVGKSMSTTNKTVTCKIN